MANALLILLSNTKPGSDHAEFNRWYDQIHALDVLDVKGTIKCNRYRVTEARLLPGVLEEPRHEYAAIYEVDASSEEALQKLADATAALAGRPQGMEISPAIDMQRCCAYLMLPIGGDIMPRRDR